MGSRPTASAMVIEGKLVRRHAVAVVQASSRLVDHPNRNTSMREGHWCAALSYTQRRNS